MVFHSQALPLFAKVYRETPYHGKNSRTGHRQRHGVLFQAVLPAQNLQDVHTKAVKQSLRVNANVSDKGVKTPKFARYKTQ